jgi:predicted nucleic acid-binding protein
MIGQCYFRERPIQLRTLDAIHLSTASIVGASVLVATDRRIRAAAESFGFTVFPP